MAVLKGSRVEVEVTGRGKVFGLVFAIARGEAKVISDDGATFRGDPTALKESKQPIPADHPSKRFKKNDRIEFQNSAFKDWKLGLVAKADSFGFLEINTDDGQTWKGVVATKARASTAPLPKHLANVPASYAKGDRVEFEEKGRTAYGVVSKAGSDRVEVTEDGGIVIHSGPVSSFRPSTHPLKTGGPDEMDRWSVVSYKLKERLSRETPCFEAVIALNGKKVIAASNRGTGGSDDFNPLHAAPAKIIDMFEADAKAWAGRFDETASEGGYRQDASDWLDWSVNKKGFGVTAADYFSKVDDSSDEMKSAFSPR